ncbi:MAG: hypothetical protein ACYS21_10360, partial [Planctomycetota bacterium]
MCQAEQTDKQEKHDENYEDFDSLAVHNPALPFQYRADRRVLIRIHQAKGANNNGPTRPEYRDVQKTARNAPGVIGSPLRAVN